MKAEVFQSLKVEGHAVISVVPEQDGTQIRSLLCDRGMPTASKLRLDLNQLPSHPRGHRSPFDSKGSGSGSATDMSEAQKREGFRLPLSPLRSIRRCEAPKLDQSSLLVVEFQSEF